MGGTAVLDQLRGKRVIVLGGLGFIGSNLSIRLVELGSRVTIVDSLVTSCGGSKINIDPIRDEVSLYISDVNELEELDGLVRDHEIIYNLVGHVSHIDSMEVPLTDMKINCESQLCILEACKKNNCSVKLIYAGTRGQYGKPRYLPVDEKHPMYPTDINGINKMAGEKYHILYNDIYGIKACSLRLTNVYGPRHQMKHSRQGVINWFIRLALEGRVLPVYGDGSQIRDCNYVDDVVEAFLIASLTEEANGSFYNLGADEPLPLLDIAKKIIDLTGKGSIKLVEFPAQSRSIEIGSYYADSSTFRKISGWKPEISLDEGLIRTIDFYQKQAGKYF